MSGIIDTIGPLLDRAHSSLERNLDRATATNANMLHAHVTKGIRDQRWKYLWASLKPDTIIRKRLKGFDPRILIEGDPASSHDLWKSYEVQRVQSGVYDVGSDAPYARAHERGYEAGGIPARPAFQPALDETVDEMVENWRDAVKESFGG